MESKEYDIEDIIKEINERLKDAETDAKTTKDDKYKWGYYQAYWEVAEIIKNREI